MKKLTSVVGLGLIAMSVLGSASQASAAPLNTNGQASFVPQTGKIDTIKPGTDEKIEMDTGDNNGTTVSDIHLMHVPDFNFGYNNETSVNTKDYSVLYESYRVQGQDAPNYRIPQFVQVADVSGIQGKKWKVTVEQTGLLKETGGHALKGSRINLHAQTLTNNVQTGDLNEIITGAAIPVGDSLPIPVKDADSTGAITIFSSKAGKTDATTTNGTISSVVFQDNYNEADYGTASSPSVTDRNAGVKLNVPQSDGVQVGKEYLANLEWTLTVEP